MNSFLLFNKLDIRQRRDVLVVLGSFMVIESVLILWHFCKSPFLYLTAVCGVLVAIFAFWHYRISKRAAFSFLPLADLSVYVYILSTTFFIIPPVSSAMPSIQYIFARLDVKIFSVAAISLLVSIFPLINDTRIIRSLPKEKHFRSVEKISGVPFGYRRCLSAISSIFILSIVTFCFIAVGNSVLMSSAIAFAHGLVSVWCFEYLYGYRTYIMRIFARTLFLGVSLALMLHTQYATILPLIVVKAIASVWGLAFVGAAYQIWRETDPEMLVPAQKYYHSLYLITLGVGHLVVYAYWIHPVFK